MNRFPLLYPYASVGNATVCFEGFQCSPGSGLGSSIGCPESDIAGTGAISGMVCDIKGRPQQHLWIF